MTAERKPPRPHDYFTEGEWDDLDRVTERWSAAGRAKEHIEYPTTWEVIRAIYAEDRDAADDYHRTVRRILDDSAARRGSA